jgi:hypothetical protein
MPGPAAMFDRDLRDRVLAKSAVPGLGSCGGGRGRDACGVRRVGAFCGLPQ